MDQDSILDSILNDVPREVRFTSRDELYAYLKQFEHVEELPRNILENMYYACYHMTYLEYPADVELINPASEYSEKTLLNELKGLLIELRYDKASIMSKLTFRDPRLYLA